MNKQQMLHFSSSFALAGFAASQRLLLTTSSTGPAIIHAQPCRYHPSELSVRFFCHWYPVIIWLHALNLKKHLPSSLSTQKHHKPHQSKQLKAVGRKRVFGPLPHEGHEVQGPR